MDKEIQVGNFVNIHCFDGSTITMQVTEIRDNIVYGVSQLGNHWANLKDVEKVITQEDKELLLKDLCARLPYGVKCCVYNNERNQEYYGREKFDITLNVDNICGFLGQDSTSEYIDIKPYLRPLSSMTEEEKNECNKLRLAGGMAVNVADYQDWLNSHHFDYRGLIERGLALVAPEDMYK